MHISQPQNRQLSGKSWLLFSVGLPITTHISHPENRNGFDGNILTAGGVLSLQGYPRILEHTHGVPAIAAVAPHIVSC